MTQTTLRFRRIASRTLGIASTLGFIVAASCSAENSENVGSQKSALSPNGIVIAEVYGGGGNSGAPFNADFVVLFNQGATAASLNGLFFQYASGGGNFIGSGAVALPNVSIQPGAYFLIQVSSTGATGAALPAPDLTLTPSIAMGGTAGKVAIVSTPLDACGQTASQCPSTNIVDLVGYGTGAQQFEGTGPAPAPSNTLSDHRKGGGCLDTDDNTADFETGAPTPKNSATAAAPCSSVPDSGTTDSGLGDAAVDSGSDGGGTTDGGSVDAGPPPVGLAIAQVYGGAGATTPFDSDYVMIFNRGSAPASLANVYVQYASAGGQFGSFAGNTIALPSTSLGVGQYFLVGMATASGSTGAPLPTPDATATTNLSSTAGKVALVHGTPLSGCGSTTPCTGGILDLVGYGSTATQFEGAATAPAPADFNSSVNRKVGGCQDTDQNGNDLESGAPTPKNTSSPTFDCSNPPDAGTGGTAGAGSGGTAGAATGGAAGSASGGTAGAATGGSAGAATGGAAGSGTGGASGGSGGSGATGGSSSGGTGATDGGVGIGGFAGKPAGGSGDDGGCGCETPGRARNTSGLALLSLLGLVAFARRRRS